jgi:hypothetical protein
VEEIGAEAEEEEGVVMVWWSWGEEENDVDGFVIWLDSWLGRLWEFAIYVANVK